MSDSALPEIPAADLARRLERGERVQVLDIRVAERVAAGRVAFGAALDFRAVPAAQLYQPPHLDGLALDRSEPLAVICGHGNSSQQATRFLRERGFAAYSVSGGMAAWETVYLPRRLAPTPSLQHVVQLDRVGKGALSYVLVSDGDAVVGIDVGGQGRQRAVRHADRHGRHVFERIRHRQQEDVHGSLGAPRIAPNGARCPHIPAPQGTHL